MSGCLPRKGDSTRALYAGSLGSCLSNVRQNDFNKDFRAKTPSTQREDFLPNWETTIGQNLRASSEICFCLSMSPDKQKRLASAPLR